MHANVCRMNKSLAQRRLTMLTNCCQYSSLIQWVCIQLLLCLLLLLNRPLGEFFIFFPDRSVFSLHSTFPLCLNVSLLDHCKLFPSSLTAFPLNHFTSIFAFFFPFQLSISQFLPQVLEREQHPLESKRL